MADESTAQVPTAESPPVETAESSTDRSATSSSEAAEGQQDDRFFDPKGLAPELQGQWKRMQGAYTKRMQRAAEIQDAADEYERFNTDPAHARRLIRERASELGLKFADVAPPATPTPSTEGIPSEFVEAIRNNLEPQLQWLAPALAKAQWAGVKTIMDPIAKEAQQTQRSLREQEYLKASEALAEKFPGWEEHEDSMSDALTYLNGPTLTHPQFPSKLEVLHWMVNGATQRTAETLKRTAAATRNRTVTGQAGRSGVSNITDQIRKADRRRDAFDLAAKHALATLQGEGRLTDEE